MDVTIGGLCGALLSVVVVCAPVSAEEPNNVGKATTAPMTESGTVGTMTEAPRGCIAVSYSMSADGHQWNEYAQNNCLRIMHCITTLYLEEVTNVIGPEHVTMQQPVRGIAKFALITINM
jgi:hypothetical protein